MCLVSNGSLKCIELHSSNWNFALNFTKFSIKKNMYEKFCPYLDA